MRTTVGITLAVVVLATGMAQAKSSIITLQQLQKAELKDARPTK